MDFAEALTIMLDGGRAGRLVWGGRSVVIQKGYPDGIPVNEQTAEALGVQPGTVKRFRRYFLIENEDGSLGPWSVTQEDILAEDWEPYE